MELKWAARALSDLVRLYEFLGSVNSEAALRAVQSLAAAPTGLLEHPRIGEKLEEFEPREVRRILVGRYEMRCEIRQSTLYVLRLWHTRERRWCVIAIAAPTSVEFFSHLYSRCCDPSASLQHEARVDRVCHRRRRHLLPLAELSRRRQFGPSLDKEVFPSVQDQQVLPWKRNARPTAPTRLRKR